MMKVNPPPSKWDTDPPPSKWDKDNKEDVVSKKKKGAGVKKGLSALNLISAGYSDSGEESGDSQIKSAEKSSQSSADMLKEFAKSNKEQISIANERSENKSKLTFGEYRARKQPSEDSSGEKKSPRKSEDSRDRRESHEDLKSLKNQKDLKDPKRDDRQRRLSADRRSEDTGENKRRRDSSSRDRKEDRDRRDRSRRDPDEKKGHRRSEDFSKREIDEKKSSRHSDQHDKRGRKEVDAKKEHDIVKGYQRPNKEDVKKEEKTERRKLSRLGDEQIKSGLVDVKGKNSIPIETSDKVISQKSPKKEVKDQEKDRSRQKVDDKSPEESQKVRNLARPKDKDLVTTLPSFKSDLASRLGPIVKKSVNPDMEVKKQEEEPLGLGGFNINKLINKLKKTQSKIKEEDAKNEPKIKREDLQIRSEVKREDGRSDPKGKVKTEVKKEDVQYKPKIKREDFQSYPQVKRESSWSKSEAKVKDLMKSKPNTKLEQVKISDELKNEAAKRVEKKRKNKAGNNERQRAEQIRAELAAIDGMEKDIKSGIGKVDAAVVVKVETSEPAASATASVTEEGELSSDWDDTNDKKKKKKKHRNKSPRSPKTKKSHKKSKRSSSSSSSDGSRSRSSSKGSKKTEREAAIIRLLAKKQLKAIKKTKSKDKLHDTSIDKKERKSRKKSRSRSREAKRKHSKKSKRADSSSIERQKNKRSRKDRSTSRQARNRSRDSGVKKEPSTSPGRTKIKRNRRDRSKSSEKVKREEVYSHRSKRNRRRSESKDRRKSPNIKEEHNRYKSKKSRRERSDSREAPAEKRTITRVGTPDTRIRGKYQREEGRGVELVSSDSEDIVVLQSGEVQLKEEESKVITQDIDMEYKKMLISQPNLVKRTTSKIRVDYDCSPSVYPVKTEPISDGDYIEITEENDGQEQVVGKVEIDIGDIPVPDIPQPAAPFKDAKNSFKDTKLSFKDDPPHYKDDHPSCNQPYPKRVVIESADSDEDIDLKRRRGQDYSPDDRHNVSANPSSSRWDIDAESRRKVIERDDHDLSQEEFNDADLKEATQRKKSFDVRRTKTKRAVKKTTIAGSLSWEYNDEIEDEEEPEEEVIQTKQEVSEQELLALRRKLASKASKAAEQAKADAESRSEREEKENMLIHLQEVEAEADRKINKLREDFSFETAFKKATERRDTRNIELSELSATVESASEEGEINSDNDDDDPEPVHDTSMDNRQVVEMELEEDEDDDEDEDEEEDPEEDYHLQRASLSKRFSDTKQQDRARSYTYDDSRNTDQIREDTRHTERSQFEDTRHTERSQFEETRHTERSQFEETRHTERSQFEDSLHNDRSRRQYDRPLPRDRENSGHSRQSADSRRNDNRHSLSSNIDDRRGRGSSETNDNAEWLTMQTAKMKMALLDKSSKSEDRYQDQNAASLSFNRTTNQALVENDLFERRRDSEFRDEPSMSREDGSRSSSSLSYQSRSGTHNLFVESDSMSEKYEQGRVQRGPQNGSRMFDEHEQGAQKGWGSETNARGGSSWVSTSSAPRDQHNQLYEDDDDAKFADSVASQYGDFDEDHDRGHDDHDRGQSSSNHRGGSFSNTSRYHRGSNEPFSSGPSRGGSFAHNRSLSDHGQAKEASDKQKCLEDMGEQLKSHRMSNSAVGGFLTDLRKQIDFKSKMSKQQSLPDLKTGLLPSGHFDSGRGRGAPAGLGTSPSLLGAGPRTPVEDPFIAKLRERTRISGPEEDDVSSLSPFCNKSPIGGTWSSRRGRESGSWKGGREGDSSTSRGRGRDFGSSSSRGRGSLGSDPEWGKKEKKLTVTMDCVKKREEDAWKRGSGIWDIKDSALEKKEVFSTGDTQVMPLNKNMKSFIRKMIVDECTKEQVIQLKKGPNRKLLQEAKHHEQHNSEELEVDTVKGGQGEDAWEYYREDLRCDIRFTKVGFEMHEYNLEQLNKPASHVIIKEHAIPLSQHDMLTLTGLNWVNDQVIEFYLQMIAKRSNTPDARSLNFPRIHVMNTYFFTRLCQGGFDTVKKWTKKLDVFDYDMLVIPVHNMEVHWAVIVVDFRVPGVFYYDSMKEEDESDILHAKAFLTQVIKYLQDEHDHKKDSQLDLKSYVKEVVDTCPQQENGSDCGLFVCKVVEYLSRDVGLRFDQNDMPYFRQRMIWEIGNYTLISP